MRILLLALFLFAFADADAQIDTIQWVQLSPLPDSIQRSICGYFLIDSNFYVVGGQMGISAPTLSVVWKYHIPTDTWYKLGNLPFGGAACAASFVLNGNGYFLTARDSVSNGDCDRMLWQYNAVNDLWTRESDFPDSPRQDGSYFVYNNRGYVGQTYGCVNWDTHFWQYDPTSNTWTQVPALPTDIAAGSVAVGTLPDDAYLFGGYDIGFNFLNDVWHLNINSNQWDSIGQMPGFGRCYAVAWGFDSLIIAGGGQENDSSGGLILANDFYRYDFSKNIWSQVVFLNSFDSTGVGAAFVFNKRGYYFGGYESLSPNYSFSNNMWSFDASKFISDTSTGITQIKDGPIFTVYPNPVTYTQGFSVSTSESGEIVFYDALGGELDDRKLKQGINPIKLSTGNEVVLYKATMQSGATENGKIVMIK